MTTNDFYTGKNPGNYQQKCPVVFVLDVSGSMRDEPISELNKGLQNFQEDIQSDDIASERLDIALVSFGSDVKVEHNFELITNYNMPKLEIRGSTNLIGGLRKGMEILKEHKKWLRETEQTYYRPYIILITDGHPDDCPTKEGITAELKEAAKNKELNFWPIGVAGANMELLNEMAIPGVGGCLPAQKLEGLKFVELFEWLSSSFSKISKSKEGDKLDISPKGGIFMITT